MRTLQPSVWGPVEKQLGRPPRRAHSPLKISESSRASSPPQCGITGVPPGLGEH